MKTNKPLSILTACLGAVAISATSLLAGPSVPMNIPDSGASLVPPPIPDPIVSFGGGSFSSARRPITNPTLFDLAIPRTQIHPIFMHHRMPEHLNVPGGGEIPLDGDLNLYALQFEIAFNDRLSLVALKDGYIDFNPDNTLNSDTGFANVGGGLKYALILDPEAQYAMSLTAMVEVPIGDRDVFQGESDGFLNLMLSNLKIHDRWQFASTLGLQIPFDNDFATQGWVSAHLSYEVTPWFIPLVEFNWFHVFDEGDGGSRFRDQAGGAVPAVAPTEGADLINWGAANDEEYITVGFGFRSRLSENVSLGVAYEIPLSDEEDNITEDRITVDLVWRF